MSLRDHVEPGSSDQTRLAQQQRTLLRERFLKTVGLLANRPCNISLCDRTVVKAVFKGIDTDCNRLLVADLETPLGTYSSALIRSTDVLCVTVPLDKPSE